QQLAYRVREAAAPSPAPPSVVSRPGLPAAGRSAGGPGRRDRTPARSLGVSRDGRTACREHGSAYRRTQARHHAGSRMERADAPGGGLDRGLCLERQDLPEPHEGRVCDHRHPLEWTQILRVARKTLEGICTNACLQLLRMFVANLFRIRPPMTDMM